MKKLLITLLALWAFTATAQVKKHDSVAILIIDRMADVIGDLESCSFTVSTANDGADLTKHFVEYDVFMSGPNKMLVNANGHEGHRQLWYNGSQLAYYDYDENNFGIIPAPATTIQMMDSVNALYDVDFPAADFFYPTFTDDLLSYADSLRFVGITRIRGKEYLHVMATGKTMIIQIWVSNDAYNLPARFTITYKNKPGHPQYLALFSNWQLNPTLPNAMFEFLPPPNAREVRIMSKKDR